MIEVKCCVWRGAWRFVVRFAGRVRVLGPACPGPIETWNSWVAFRQDALPEALRYQEGER